MTRADSVHSTPPTNTSANNIADPSRRGFLAQAAGAAAGSAVLIGGSTIGAPAIASHGGPKAKPIDVKGARPELRDAIWALEEAHDALKDAAAEFRAAWDLWGQWEKKNPRPGSPRAYRKWDRRQDRYCEEIGLDPKRVAEGAAYDKYKEAQLALGGIRAQDLDELALKSVASLAYEWSAGQDRRHLRFTQQVVAFSVAWDATLLLVSPSA